MKLKVQMAQNQMKNKEKEMNTVKKKLKDMILKEEKCEKKDNSNFLKIFGKEPNKGQDAKVLQILHAHETQREKLETKVEWSEREIQKLNDRNVMLKNENRALSKCDDEGRFQYYLSQNEGQLATKLDGMANTVKNMEDKLAEKDQLIKSNLAELEKLRGEKLGLVKLNQSLEKDLENIPSPDTLHFLHNKIAALEQEK